MIKTFVITLFLSFPLLANGQVTTENFVMQFYQLILPKDVTILRITKISTGFMAEGKAPNRKLIEELVPKLKNSEKLSRFELLKVRSQFLKGKFKIFFDLYKKSN